MEILLGMKIILSLVAVFIISLGSSSIYAESDNDTIIVNSDKFVYQTGDSMIISGIIEEKKMPVIALRVFDPSGIILSANNLEIEDDNTFSKVLFLDSPFYGKPGIYTTTLDYGKESVELNFEIDNGKIAEESGNILDNINPEIILMVSDKTTYYNDEFIAILGIVSSIDEPSVLIGIFDPFGIPTGFYFGDIDSNNEFFVSFLAKSGVNFKTEGIYSAKAFYGDLKFEIEFDFLNEEKSLNDKTIDENIIEESHNDHESTNNEEQTKVEKDNEVVLQSNIDLSKDTFTAETKSYIKTPILVVENTQPVTTEIKKIESKQNIVKKPQAQIADNLTVEDVVLGIMLNQIVLNCDSSDYNDFISYYDGMGPALMRLCKFNEALTFFDKELKDDPNNLKILTNKGAALSKLGLYQESIFYYDAALESESKYLPALNNKANALMQLGFWKDAQSIYNKALGIYPGNNLLQQNLNKANEQLLKFSDSNKSINSIQQITTTVVDKTVTTIKQVNQRPTNVLDQIGVAFSSFSAMIFGFLN